MGGVSVGGRGQYEDCSIVGLNDVIRADVHSAF